MGVFGRAGGSQGVGGGEKEGGYWGVRWWCGWGRLCFGAGGTIGILLGGVG